MDNQPSQIDTSTTIDQARDHAVAVQPASSHPARLSRVIDYQISSLEKDDPLEANLGSINSGLMRVALWLDKSIEQALESSTPSIERLHQILPSIEAYLRVTRQVDRFAQIELRAVEARKPKPTGADRAALCLDAPS